MPPKKTNSKKQDKKNEEKDLEIINKLKKLLKEYERQCVAHNSLVDRHLKDALKNHISDGKLIYKFILQGKNDRESLLPKKISPLLKAIRINWYKMIKELHLWEMEITREEISDLVGFFEQPSYPIEYLEISDCHIDSHSLQEFSRCFSANCSLSSLVLDFTDLQFDGLVALCSGLRETKTIVKLSLCYCNLTSACGQVLGKMISECSISELYVDGNNLECIGLINIIELIVDNAEQERIQHEQETIQISEELQQQKDVSAVSKYTPMATLSSDKIQSIGSKGKDEKKAKKKKKKKKKKKGDTPKAPPKCGPYLTILHIADNGVDGMTVGSDGNVLLEVINLISRWITTSSDLLEIDIDDNLIGEFGGREILNALERRKEGGLKPIYMKVTHRLSEVIFKSIITIASGSSKRGGKKKKKKKGKAGKRKV